MANCLIIGYGWLGKPLAKVLQQKGMTIYATTSQLNKATEMKADMISAELLEIEQGVLQWKVQPNIHFDTVIFTLPPFLEALDSMVKLFNGLSFSQLIFTSSTGVYVEKNAFLDEDATVNPSHKVSMMEEKIKEFAPDKYVILRLAGHVGPNRHPLRYFLRQQTIISNGNTPVNLIHQSDMIRAIVACITQHVQRKTYNICWPEHPSKKDYYGKLAKEFADEILEFEDGNIGKKIDGSKITKDLLFEYEGSIQNINLLDLRKDNI
mgnify:CR=1 FL=1|jgi:nucleoside-diphosphate-sugar epimerase